MRLGGLASGMDTDSMVDQLMKAENMKVDRIEAEKQVVEWQKESLNGLNKDFANFILDGKKDLEYNKQGNPGNLDWVRSATSSDESVGTAIAGKKAVEGKHTIKVESLVKGVSGASVKDLTEDDWKSESGGIGAFKFTVNGKEVEVGENDSLETIAGNINKAAGAGVNASYDKDLGRFFISTEGEGSSSGIRFEAVEVGVDPERSDDQFGLDVFLNTISVKMTEAGKNDKNEDMGSTLTASNNFNGADGIITYNGAENITIDSNQKTINGVNFDFKTTGEFTVNVNTDADSIVDKVKKFVDDYNKIIEQAGKLTTEKQNRNFKPLTDEQREAMSEKEIEKWEEKAKSGLLRGDMDVEKMLSSLRLGLYEEMDTDDPDAFKFITEIGITTQKYSSGGVGGLLEIDEDKLRSAISKNADSVVDILFKNGDREAKVSEGSKKKTNQGMINRIFDDLTAGMKNIISKSGPGEDSALFRKVKSNIMTDFVTKGGRYSGRGSISDLDNDVLNFDKKIEKLKERLARKEEMYFAQFTAMEKAMQKANSQGDWLMQQTQM